MRSADQPKWTSTVLRPFEKPIVLGRFTSLVPQLTQTNDGRNEGAFPTGSFGAACRQSGFGCRAPQGSRSTRLSFNDRFRPHFGHSGVADRSPKAALPAPATGAVALAAKYSPLRMRKSLLPVIGAAELVVGKHADTRGRLPAEHRKRQLHPLQYGSRRPAFLFSTGAGNLFQMHRKVGRNGTLGHSDTLALVTRRVLPKFRHLRRPRAFSLLWLYQ